MRPSTYLSTAIETTADPWPPEIIPIARRNPSCLSRACVRAAATGKRGTGSTARR